MQRANLRLALFMQKLGDPGEVGISESCGILVAVGIEACQQLLARNLSDEQGKLQINSHQLQTPEKEAPSFLDMMALGLPP